MLAVGALLAILRLLLGRPRAVRSRDILLFLGLGLHLPLVRVVAFATPSEADTVLQDFLEILFSCHTVNGIPPLPQQGGVGGGS